MTKVGMEHVVSGLLGNIHSQRKQLGDRAEACSAVLPCKRIDRLESGPAELGVAVT